MADPTNREREVYGVGGELETVLRPTRGPEDLPAGLLEYLESEPTVTTKRAPVPVWSLRGRTIDKDDPEAGSYEFILQTLAGLYNGEFISKEDADVEDLIVNTDKEMGELSPEAIREMDAAVGTQKPKRFAYDPDELDIDIEEHARRFFPNIFDAKTFDPYLAPDLSPDERRKQLSSIMEHAQRVAKSYLAGTLAGLIDELPPPDDDGNILSLGFTSDKNTDTGLSDVEIFKSLVPKNSAVDLDISVWKSERDQLAKSFPNSLTSERQRSDIISAIVSYDSDNYRMAQALQIGRGRDPVVIDGITITAFEQTQFVQAVLSEENIQKIINGTLSQPSSKANYQDAVNQYFNTNPEDTTFSIRDYNTQLRDRDQKQLWADKVVDGFLTPESRAKAIRRNFGLSTESGGLGFNELAYTTERAKEEINLIALEMENALSNLEAQLIAQGTLSAEEIASTLSSEFIRISTDQDFVSNSISRVNSARTQDERKLSEDRRTTRMKAANADPISLFVDAGVDLQDAPEDFLEFLEEEARKELRRASLGKAPFEPSQVIAQMVRDQPQLYGSRGAARFDIEGPGPTPTRDEMSELFDPSSWGAPTPTRQPPGPVSQEAPLGPPPYTLTDPRTAGMRRSDETGLTGDWSQFLPGEAETPYEYTGTMPPGIGQDVPGRGVPISRPDIFQGFGEEIDAVQAARQGQGVLPIEEVISAVQDVAGNDPELFKFLLSSGEGTPDRLSILLKEFEKAQQEDIDARLRKTIYGHDAIVEPGQQYVEDSEGNLVAAPETGVELVRDKEGNLVPSTPGASDVGPGGLSAELLEAVNKTAGTLVKNPFAEKEEDEDVGPPYETAPEDVWVTQPEVTMDDFVNLAKQEVLAQPKVKFLDFLKKRKDEEKELFSSLLGPPRKQRAKAGRNILVRSI